MSKMVFLVKPINPPKNNNPVMRTVKVVEVWRNDKRVGTIEPTKTGIKIKGYILVQWWNA